MSDATLLGPGSGVSSWSTWSLSATSLPTHNAVIAMPSNCCFRFWSPAGKSRSNVSPSKMCPPTWCACSCPIYKSPADAGLPPAINVWQPSGRSAASWPSTAPSMLPGVLRSAAFPSRRASRRSFPISRKLRWMPCRAPPTQQPPKAAASIRSCSSSTTRGPGPEKLPKSSSPIWN